MASAKGQSSKKRQEGTCWNAPRGKAADIRVGDAKDEE